MGSRYEEEEKLLLALTIPRSQIHRPLGALKKALVPIELGSTHTK